MAVPKLVGKYLKSAVLERDYPPEDRPEVVIAGRSNAGKSSFINMLTNQKLAHVSGQAGKTRLLNFFDLGPHYRLVDIPGYGFAARAHDETQMWKKMVETYLSSRPNLVGLLLLADVRRDWTAEEDLLLQYLRTRNVPAAMVFTKIDKLNQKDLARRKAKLQSEIKKRAFTIESSFFVSLLPTKDKRNLTVEVENFVFTKWVHPSVRQGVQRG